MIVTEKQAARAVPLDMQEQTVLFMGHAAVAGGRAQTERSAAAGKARPVLFAQR